MRRLLAALVLCTAGTVSPAMALTGGEWSRLTDREKFVGVLASIIELDAYDVPFQRGPNTYVRLLERILEANPSLAREDVTNLLASALFRLEPPSRQPLISLQEQERAA